MPASNKICVAVIENETRIVFFLRRGSIRLGITQTLGFKGTNNVENYVEEVSQNGICDSLNAKITCEPTYGQPIEDISRIAFSWT
jgi:hypothetical protein